MNYYQPTCYSYSCYSMLSFALSVPNTIYNYLYISKLYIISEIERTSEINCHNCNCHKLKPFSYAREVLVYKGKKEISVMRKSLDDVNFFRTFIRRYTK